MNVKKITFSRAKKSRLQRAIEQIILVRKERGKTACGDFLLHSALSSICSHDTESTRIYIEKFLSIVQNVNLEHRTILNVVLTKLLAHQKLNIPSSYLNILDLLLGIVKLVGRNLLSCTYLGIYIPVYYRYAKNS